MQIQHSKQQECKGNVKLSQLERLTADQNPILRDYLKGDGKLDLDRLPDVDDVNLKLMFAELDELEAGQEQG